MDFMGNGYSTTSIEDDVFCTYDKLNNRISDIFRCYGSDCRIRMMGQCFNLTRRYITDVN